VRWVLAAGVALAAVPARSDGGSDDIFGFYAEEATVVAAAKHSQAVADAPASVSVIAAADIEAHGYRTLAEALQGVPGFHVLYDRNYTYLWVRGFARPGDYNSRVLLLINGHRFNENLYGSAFVGREFGLDLRSVERIEVIHGPGSALYGDSAFFAVVNVVTRRPEAAPISQAAFAGGSWGTGEAFAAVAPELPGRWGLYAAGFGVHMRGQDLYYPEFRAANGGRVLGADSERMSGGFLSLERPGWLLQAHAAGRRKVIPTAAYGTRFNDAGSYTWDARGFVELQHEHDVARRLHVLARAYADWYRYDGDYIYDNPEDPALRLVNRDASKADWYGGELRIRVALPGPGNAVMLGHEFERNLRGLQRNFDVEPYAEYLNSDVRPWRAALFAQQEMRPHRRLSLTLGLRWDRYETFGGTLNPRTAAVIDAGRGNRIKLLYGSAFRAPSPYELRYETPVAENLANWSLDPETVRSLEAIWERGLPRHGALSLAYFRNDIRGLINQAEYEDAQWFENRGAVHSHGVQLGTRLHGPAGIWGRLGYVLQETTEEGGAELSSSPHHSASATLARDVGRWNGSLALEGFFVSARATTRSATLPPTALLSLHLSMRPWARGPRLFGSVRNIMDTDYRVSGAAEHAQNAIPQDGRSWNLGLDLRFGPRSTGR
jgi:iron complex outermembrane receptor protein